MSPPMVDAPVRAPKADTPARSTKKSVGDLVGELRELVVAYAKQETIEPFKGLGRQLLFGLLGSFLLGGGAGASGRRLSRSSESETPRCGGGCSRSAPGAGCWKVRSIGQCSPSCRAACCCGSGSALAPKRSCTAKSSSPARRSSSPSRS